MAQMQVRRGRIETGLDAQRAVELQPRLQVFALDDFLGAATDQVERGLRIGHIAPCGTLASGSPRARRQCLLIAMGCAKSGRSS